MAKVCFYFQVHQPYRLRRFSVFDIGQSLQYSDEVKNKAIIERVAQNCYVPMNTILLDAIRRNPDKIKVAFSITGTALDQMELYAPEALESFQALARTGCVEFLAETYYHSLAFHFSESEFRRQVDMHKDKIFKLFGHTPQVFRNTELIYSNQVAEAAEKMGFVGVLCEGAKHVLQGRSPNYVYSPPGSSVRLLLKNYRLSDDIAFRFSDKNWKEWPIDPTKFQGWMENQRHDLINLFLDYETFGEHHPASSGILEFMEELLEGIAQNGSFITPTEAIKGLQAKGEVDVPLPTSWADEARDMSAWLGNRMQDSAVKNLYALENEIKRCGDDELSHVWGLMQTSDHLYYMCTKHFQDGDVHKYFNPYDSPYEAFIAFMNIINDLRLRVKDAPALAHE